MKTRPLGKTGYNVSELGYGSWGLGGYMWRGVDDADGRKALREAVGHGITFFDTTLVYGDRHSEQLIAQTFQDLILGWRPPVTIILPPVTLIRPDPADAHR